MRKAEGLDLGAEPLGIKKILEINVVEYPPPLPLGAQSRQLIKFLPTRHGGSHFSSKLN